MVPQDGITVLTGATGFVGSLVLERSIERGAQVVALVRADDDAAARGRLEQLAEQTWGDPAVVAGVEAVAADLERERLGLTAPRTTRSPRAPARSSTAPRRCASTCALSEAEAINVTGTERMLALAARGASGRGARASCTSRPRCVHGRAHGLAREEGPPAAPAFRNTYELTKRRAEQAVAELDGAAIVRPSIVVGDSRTGWTSSFNVVCPPLRALVSGRLDVVPAPADAILDLVPVDHVVDVVCALLDDPATAGVVQAVGGELAPTMGEFARSRSSTPAARCSRACRRQPTRSASTRRTSTSAARFEFARAQGARHAAHADRAARPADARPRRRGELGPPADTAAQPLSQPHEHAVQS